MNSRDRIFRLIKNRCSDRVPLMPITMMYAADNLGVKYREYASDHRVLVDAQIAMAEKFGFDQVSCISDPAREASDLGAEIEWYDNQPPSLNETKALLADKGKFCKLATPDPTQGPRMSDRVAAAALFKQRVGQDKIIEGWIEGPCAMAADLRGINTLMLDFHDDPNFVNDLFEYCVAMELKFAEAQIQAGADIMGVGDAASSLVGPKLYETFVWPFQKKLMDALHELGTSVRLHICGKTRRIFKGMGLLKCEIVDLDWMNPMNEARDQMGAHQVLLGNIDPVRCLKDGTSKNVYDAIAECHRQSGSYYIIGAGCEVARGTPEANLRALSDYALAHQPNQFEPTTVDSSPQVGRG